MRIFLAFLAFCAFSAKAVGASDINTLYQIDQKTRSAWKEGQAYDRRSEAVSDARLRARLFEITAESLSWTATEFAQAATILQHSNGINAGQNEPPRSQDNHIFAYFLARRAYRLGHKDGAWLMTVCLDRWLQVSGIDRELGVWIDSRDGKARVVLKLPQISDAERFAAGLPFAVAESLVHE